MKNLKADGQEGGSDCITQANPTVIHQTRVTQVRVPYFTLTVRWGSQQDRCEPSEFSGRLPER
jgi:hypothetical protein